MQEASLLGALKIILIILLIYYGLKIITRFLGPLLLTYITKKAGEKVQQHFQQHHQNATTTEPKDTINKKQNRKSTNKDVGEYIDFEEID